MGLLLDDFPKAAKLSGSMSAVLGRNGKLTFSALRLAKRAHLGDVVPRE